jgi:hypothetical protein
MTRRHEDDETIRKVERLLEDLEPVELPPFYRRRLLARLRRASRPATWGERLRAPKVAWAVAAASVAALVVVLVVSRTGTDRGPVVAPRLRIAAASDIEPVMPVDNAVVSSADVEIVAAIHPPVEDGIVRLYVDDTDVTGLAEVTDEYVMYSPGRPFEEGEHIVTIEIRDGSGRTLRDVSWLFYTLNGTAATGGRSI